MQGVGPPAAELRAVTWTRIQARHSADGGSLALRFLLRGRDAWASATLPAGTAAPVLVPLQFGRGEERAFSALQARESAVPVLGRAVWNDLRQRLAVRLAPATPHTATLVLVAERELLAVRRGDGSAVIVSLADRPAGVKVARTVRGPEFPRELAAVLADGPVGRWSRDTPLLLLTGGTPEFLYLDLRRGRTIFLKVPESDGATLPLPVLDKAAITTRGLLSLSVRSGALPVLKNPFSTLARGVSNVLTFGQAATSRVVRPLPAGPPPPLSPGAPMDPVQWERELDRIASAPATPATLRFLIDGDAFFPELFQAVQEAKRSVDLQVYIFDNDECAVPLADALKSASRRPGVRVRVMMDEAASLQAALSNRRELMPPGFRPPDSIVDHLRQDSQAKVRPMAMLGLTASHTKIIVVDEERAWLGGMNVGREYRYDWHDMMIEVRGPLVGWIQRDFAKAWAHAGWAGDFAAGWRKLTRPSTAAARIPVPAGAIPVRPLYTTAWNHEIAGAQIAALKRVRNRVYVQNAYLTDHEYLTELIAARHRGVDVRVIFPQENDSGVMKANSRALTATLLAHGIRVWHLPGMSHVKAAVYDGWACAGSANLDRLSMRVNNECSIGFSDPDTVDSLVRQLFETDFARGREVAAVPETAWTGEISDALLQALAGQL